MNHIESLQHEAGDRIFVIMSNLEEYVAMHGFVLGFPDIKSDVDLALDFLHSAYKKIWNMDLTIPDPVV